MPGSTQSLGAGYLPRLSFLGGSQTQSQAAWVRGRGWHGQWKRSGQKPRARCGTKMALGASGIGVGQDREEVRCPGMWQGCGGRGW